MLTESFETLIKLTHRKAEEALEYKMTKPRETFHFNSSIDLGPDSDWMVGLVNLQVYNSVSNKTNENNKFELYEFPDSKSGGNSYEKVRDEIERDLDISDITATDLQEDTMGPIVIKEYREQLTKRMDDGGSINILQGYITSILQDFESYFRTEVDLVEDDIRLVLDEYNPNFIIYELELGIYTF